MEANYDPRCNPPLRCIGFGIGAFFSLMSASFAYEDPYLRTQGKTAAQLNATQKASAIFKDMGRGMWTSGKGFGKVGALYAGIECVIESVRTHSYPTPFLLPGMGY